MRVRPVLAVLAAAAAACTAGPAQAAPPVGCYGFPSIPAAFVCVTEFTPTGAVPAVSIDQNGSTVTVPAFCAGACYGPISIDVPKATTTPGSGEVATVTHNGQTYEIRIDELPPLPPVDVPPLPPVDVPPLPPVGDGEQCPGSRPLRPELQRAEPFVCVRVSNDYQYGTTVYVGTCATGTCENVYQIQIEQLAGVPDALLCRVYPKSC